MEVRVQLFLFNLCVYEQVIQFNQLFKKRSSISKTTNLNLSETAKEVQTYLFSTKNFGWINCDRFYDDSRVKTDLLDMFVLPDQEKNITETYNYSVFDSLISVLPINLDDSGQ